MILPLAQPLARPLARPLASFMSGGLDPDAAAVIALLEAEGVTVTSTRRNAIRAFYAAIKPLAAYSALKRLHIPGFQNAEADRICWKTGAKLGTWVSTVNRANGQVASSATDVGHYDFGSSAASRGLTPGSAWLGALMITATVNHQYLGSQGISSQIELMRHTTTGITTDWCDGSVGRNLSTAARRDGIISAVRSGGVMRHFQRLSTGRTQLGTYTRDDSGTMPELNTFALSKNNAGSPTSGNTNPMGAFWQGTGVSDADDEAFTLALKTLWQTLFTRTIPG
jgi:hypothetical protein